MNSRTADNSDARNQWGTTRWQERIEREDAERQRVLAEQMEREKRGQPVTIACVSCLDPMTVEKEYAAVDARSCPKCIEERAAGVSFVAGTRDAALAEAKAQREEDAKQRRIAILRMRKAGATYLTIARQVGADHGLVRRVLKEAGVE